VFDTKPGEGQVVDFDQLADSLLEQGQQSSPSAVHGCLSGALAAGAHTEAELAPMVLGQALELQMHGQLTEQVMQIYTSIAASLVDEDFGYNLLLPSDDEEIAVRAQAVADWCRGFLAGYALAVAEVGSGVQGSPSSDNSEILRDMAAMCEVTVDEEEDQDENEVEGSYFELVEYLRFAVLNLHAELLLAGDKPDDEGDGQVLH